MCQERLQRSLSLFVFGRGDGRARERESVEEGERVAKEVVVVVVVGSSVGGAQEPRKPPELDGWPVTSLHSRG